GKLRRGWNTPSGRSCGCSSSQRRDELARLEWSELSTDVKVWRLPPSRTKTADGRTILLAAAASAILHGLPRGNALWVFTWTGRAPIKGFSTAKRRLDDLSGVRGWTFHDFRRTAATRLAELGTAPHVVEAVLGHRPVKGVAGIYNMAQYA